MLLQLNDAGARRQRRTWEPRGQQTGAPDIRPANALTFSWSYSSRTVRRDIGSSCRGVVGPALIDLATY